MKIFFRRIHLYLSLAAGLVILTACLTGAILVFEKDLQMALDHDRYYVAAGEIKLPPQYIIDRVKDSFPTAKISGIKVYKDAKRSAEVAVSFPAVKAKSSDIKKGRSAEHQPGYTLFADPYSGKVLEKYSYRETAFYKVFALHRWLLGTAKGPGKIIVGVATFIFLFIILTGIILWWPRTRKIMMQRLRIKWDAGWKRINHDLHLVLGFYSAILLFIFAFTGLAWSFEWFNNGIYKVTNSSLKAPPPPKSTFIAGAQKISADQAFNIAATTFNNAEWYSLSLPKDSADAVTVSALSSGAVHENATDAVYIDQYSGAVLGTLPYDKRSLGARVRSTFKPVHTGSIWGLPSKIIAFIVCLFGVSFPITGTIMWINRTRKKKSQSL
ncbi:MAG: hypothetical protein JWP88_1967 [Flaviaesturariibacter sp.]|nr:hypothetical protein [Flaviaesturariibacter sp.]